MWIVVPRRGGRGPEAGRGSEAGSLVVLLCYMTLTTRVGLVFSALTFSRPLWRDATVLPAQALERLRAVFGDAQPEGELTVADLTRAIGVEGMEEVSPPKARAASAALGGPDGARLLVDGGVGNGEGPGAPATVPLGCAMRPDFFFCRLSANNVALPFHNITVS